MKKLANYLKLLRWNLISKKDFNYLAVYKGLRALNVGLTTGVTVGRKNRQNLVFAKGSNIFTSALYRIPAKGWARANNVAQTVFTQQKVNRYRLTLTGKIFITLMINYYWIDFVQKCKNSVFNLAPACSGCNRSKNDADFWHK